VSDRPSDTDPVLERLRRQAARDRAARLEAEGIAEVRLRLAYQRAADLELLAMVATLVNETGDVEDALASTARAVRRHGGFAVAHVLVPDSDGAFVSSDIWDADQEQLEFFELCLEASAHERFVPPRGLPGEVAHAHEARWLPDLAVATNFPRALAVGGGAAWAFPVLVGTEVVAVVEFLDPHPRAVDTSLLALASSLSVQLAHAFRWERLRAGDIADRQRLEAAIARADAGGGTGVEAAAPPARDAAPLVALAREAADALERAGDEPELVARIRAAVGDAHDGGQAAAVSSVASGARVLVVDDNPVNRMLAGAMLGRLGIEHDLVDGGLPALAALAEQRFDLVLMDVQMPGIDGREATRRWRSDGRGVSALDVPVVALTAHVGDDERSLCADAGMDDFLSKPFGLAELEALCRRWLAAPEGQPAR
jgi:CheY-like chemotaxis protein